MHQKHCPVKSEITPRSKESLSLIFGFKKFHNFLYDHTFTLVTDHKPLLTIFGPKKGILVMAANRLLRWAIILAAYIQYKPTAKYGNADTLKVTYISC